MWKTGTTVWKSELKIAHTQEVSVPKGAEFLCAGEQRGRLCIWYRCDPEADKVIKTIIISGTGHEVTPQGDYLGTALFQDGYLVLHVFVV